MLFDKGGSVTVWVRVGGVWVAGIGRFLFWGLLLRRLFVSLNFSFIFRTFLSGLRFFHFLLRLFFLASFNFLHFHFLLWLFFFGGWFGIFLVVILIFTLRFRLWIRFTFVRFGLGFWLWFGFSLFFTLFFIFSLFFLFSFCFFFCLRFLLLLRFLFFLSLDLQFLLCLGFLLSFGFSFLLRL